MKRLLVIRFSSLGDVVLVTGVIRLFKENNSNIIIDILTFDEYKDVFKNHPSISEVISIDRKLLYFKFFKKIVNVTQNYDYIVDLQKNIKTLPLSVIRFSNYYSCNKFSFKRRLFVHFKMCKSKLNTHITERYIEAFSKIGEVFYNNIEDLRPVIYMDKKDNVKKRIILHPFASKKTKEWPYAYDLLRLLKNEGYDVVIVGKGNFQAFKGAINFANKTELQELIYEINKAVIIISTDSGPMHLAIALNKIVIAIFGSTTKELGFYPPFKSTYVIENKELSCRPCHVHGRNNCPQKHFKCMKEIYPENVMELIATITS